MTELLWRVVQLHDPNVPCAIHPTEQPMSGLRVSRNAAQRDGRGERDAHWHDFRIERGTVDERTGEFEPE